MFAVIRQFSALVSGPDDFPPGAGPYGGAIGEVSGGCLFVCLPGKGYQCHVREFVCCALCLFGIGIGGGGVVKHIHPSIHLDVVCVWFYVAGRPLGRLHSCGLFGASRIVLCS